MVAEVRTLVSRATGGPTCERVCVRLQGNLLCPLRTALVGPQPQSLVATSLHDNLLGNLPDAPQSDRLWQLCRSVGMSTDLIGAEHCEGWDSKALNPDLLSHSDLLCTDLVRALLKRPAFLLLHRVDMRMLEQQMPAVRKFLDLSLDAALRPSGASSSCHVAAETHTHAHGRPSVILCAPREVLERIITSDDLVLKLDPNTPCTKAYLSHATQAAADDSAARNTHEHETEDEDEDEEESDSTQPNLDSRSREEEESDEGEPAAKASDLTDSKRRERGRKKHNQKGRGKGRAWLEGDVIDQ